MQEQSRLVFLPRGEQDLEELIADRGKAKQLKAVRKALALMQTNLRHPGLQTHKYHSLKGPKGQQVFEAYAEQGTPAAYRTFWCYGTTRNEIVIIAITEHP
jgi:hypothetical protein